jgi:translation initiation factor 1
LQQSAAQPFGCAGFAVKLSGFVALSLVAPISVFKRLCVAKKTTSLSGLGGLVFSTDTGRHCPDCSQPLDACICKQLLIPAGDGIARVRRESKGRGGKTVTTISGVPLAEAELKELASALKRRCGTGGALKEGVIEIQGDHVQLLIDELIKRGFKAKKSGG